MSANIRFCSRTEYIKNLFFQSLINNWSKPDPIISVSGCYRLFHISLLNYIRPAEGKTYHINNSVTIKLLTKPS